VGGVPLLIDPGTGLYTVDVKVRDRFRATASHNTLVVDDRWQSVPNGPFHWTSAASAAVHRWRTAGVFDYFDASHDGYAPLEHRRRVLALHGELLVVADLVTGPGAHALNVHWHLDPRWRVTVIGRTVRIGNGSTRVGLVVPHGRLTAIVGDAEAGL